MANTMLLTRRARFLKSLFTLDHRVRLGDVPVEIHPCPFVREMGNRERDDPRDRVLPGDFYPVPDNRVVENERFSYPVFLPRGASRASQAIILLHGLNERDWDKYLPWAERLLLDTGKAVILFPIAFHVNRVPTPWRDSRVLHALAGERRRGMSDAANATFVNVAISTRLSACPSRFHLSGKETLFNLWQLVAAIRDGRHPLFHEGTTVDLFAYSIGALLAQVLLLADPCQLTTASRLFIFCGGALFSYMDGSARDIIDREAYSRVRSFYLNEFLSTPGALDDPFDEAFRALILPGLSRERREAFFERARARVRVVTLDNDTVMPTAGARAALGEGLAREMLDEMSFPFPCTHQQPFPLHERVSPSLVHRSFEALFSRAAALLA
ncbi:MAG: DUF6051 family protein [Odoribacteraceae bacterium]|jgi:pimeloyl-ACP methyl ester carboxylesterase|nr:DUF6051 family protein [Odoribacteraceae bacterium]